MSIPTRLRFQVLERDAFTCQYCGAKAPDVVLHVDHVIPVSLGGRNEADNLATACHACNLGKGRSELRCVPDAVLERSGNAYVRGATIRDEMLAALPEASIPATPKDAPPDVLARIESEHHALRVMIAASRLSQAFIAGALDISCAYISKLASGARPIPERLVGPLCAVTGSNLLRQYRDAHAHLDEVDELAQALRSQ